MGNMIIVTGLIVILMGLLYKFLGLFHLPGDFYIDKGSIKFYFPLTSSLILSFIVTVILTIFKK